MIKHSSINSKHIPESGRQAAMNKKFISNNSGGSPPRWFICFGSVLMRGGGDSCVQYPTKSTWLTNEVLINYRIYIDFFLFLFFGN